MPKKFAIFVHILAFSLLFHLRKLKLKIILFQKRKNFYSFELHFVKIFNEIEFRFLFPKIPPPPIHVCLKISFLNHPGLFYFNIFHLHIGHLPSWTCSWWWWWPTKSRQKSVRNFSFYLGFFGIKKAIKIVN